MADISAEIAAFQSAVYGEDVRTAMVNLANKVNNESSAAATTVAEYDTRLSDVEADGYVTTDKLADDSVTTDKLADDSVTLSKLGNDIEITPPDGSISTVKLADGSVTNAKLAQSGGVLDEVSELKSAFETQTESSEFVFASGYITLGGMTIGSTVNLTPVESENYQYAVVDVSEGDKTIINGTGGATPRLWGFIDADNKLISSAASAITASDLIITAPANAAKLIVNINIMQTVIANFGYCALLALPNRIAHAEAEIDTHGDKIEQLEAVIETTVYPDVYWETGRFSSTGNTSGSTRTDCIRTNNFIQIPVSKYKIVVPENIVAHMYIYSANASSAFVETYELQAGINEHSIPIGYYFKTYIDYTSGANIDVSVGDSIVISYNVGGSNLINEIKNTLDYEVISDYSSMAIFQTVGVLGDSFASGGTAGGYDRSWPQILARLMGLTATNYSSSGWSTLDWLNGSDYGLTKLLSDEPQQLYMIDFGINDHTRIEAGQMSLGTIADINKINPTQNANSFYGYYGRIVSNIIAHAPNAKIVLMSVPREAERVMDSAIEEIADLFDLPYMYLPDDPFFVSAQYTLSISNGHPCAYGYGGMARAINRLMTHLMYKYHEYFRDFGTV